MRDLKFRAWCDRDKKFWNEGKGYTIKQLALSVRELVVADWFDLQQFTGLQDKNGKEIYEGDIVSVYDPKNIFVVRFGKVIRNVLGHNGMDAFKVELNTFYFESPKDGKPYFSILDNEFGENDMDNTVVIGNIFENKELLT